MVFFSINWNFKPSKKKSILNKLRYRFWSFVAKGKDKGKGTCNDSGIGNDSGIEFLFDSLFVDIDLDLDKAKDKWTEGWKDWIIKFVCILFKLIKLFKQQQQQATGNVLLAFRFFNWSLFIFVCLFFLYWCLLWALDLYYYVRL